MPTARARHVGYVDVNQTTGTGTAENVPNFVPLVRLMPDAFCASVLPERLAARHIDFRGGYPRAAYAWSCCDAVPINASRVQQECYDLSVPPGISDVAYVYLFDASNCWSARGKKVKLVYDSVQQAWFGSVQVRGGTMNFKWECNPDADPFDADKFPLTITGCEDKLLHGELICTDPIVVSYSMTTFDECCDCNTDIRPGTGSPITAVAPEINIYVVANCRKTVMARHVGYVSPDQFSAVETGTGTFPTEPIPIVARSRNCVYDQAGEYKCDNMQCPVMATITGSGPCSCMTNAIGLDHLGGVSGWIGSYFACDGLDVTITMACENAGNGMVTLTLRVTCGADNTGTASITIPAEALEDLDETFNVNMETSEFDCIGDGCTYIYVDMAAMWNLIDEDCLGLSCLPCEGAPVNPPASPVDGQIHNEPCPTDAPPICCNGGITVRVMR